MTPARPINTSEQEAELIAHRKMRANSSFGGRGRTYMIYTPVQAEEAIKARQAGDWENVELQKLGRLSNSEARDVLYIRAMTSRPLPQKIPLFNPDLHKALR